MLVKCSAEDCENNRLGMCCKKAITLSVSTSYISVPACDDYEEEEK